MLGKLILWMIGMTSPATKKMILIRILDDILDSRSASIDKQLGEMIVSKVIKSTGNDITAFVVKG